MSMNIAFVARRGIAVLKIGKLDVQEVWNNWVWQTPTEITYTIKNSDDPIQAYKDWVMTFSKDEELPIYDDEGVWMEKEPVRFETYNAAKQHIERFQEWIDDMTQEGYTIEAEVL